MKKKIYLAAAICLCCGILSVNAQSGLLAYNNVHVNTDAAIITNDDPDQDYDGHAPPLYIGFRFMPTFTSLDFHKSEEGPLETTLVLDYGFGGLIGVNFSEHVGLQAEVIYLMMSQKYQEHQKAEQTVKLSYINVPLMLVLNTNYNNPVNLNVCFGPQIGINTGSKIESGESNGTDTIHAVLAVKPADLGFAYGAGLDFGHRNFKISVGFRGVYGLLDISDQSESLTTDEYYILDRSHVKTYSGYIGVAFGF